MAKYSKAALTKLSRRLDVDPRFFVICVEESVVDVTAIKGALRLQNGTVLRLRRLQRLCMTFEVDLHVALWMLRESHGDVL